MIEIILKNFKNPDEIRKFEKGKFEFLQVADMTIGKGSYEPGWKWSIDVSPLSGTEFCEVEHLGMVISGSATVAFKNGNIQCNVNYNDSGELNGSYHEYYNNGNLEYDLPLADEPLYES